MSEPLEINKEYSRISELFFAVWNNNPPINYIWIDFENQQVVGGHHDAICDLAGERRRLNDQGGKFVELISYDENGKPILHFDNYTFEEDVPFVKANRADLLRFLAVLQKIDVLSWRNSFPSHREGISWRLDIYSVNGGEKHSSGQARFPVYWAEFGKALGELLQAAQPK